jgi:hypothetical protein
LSLAWGTFILAVGAIGNEASTIIRGPGLNNWDVSLIKNVTIHERLRFQFRASAFNVVNHTQFAGLNTSATFNAGILGRCNWGCGWCYDLEG